MLYRTVAWDEAGFDKSKFVELLVYVCSKMQDQPTFGDTVLNKVLAEIEWRAYETLRSPITHARFQRNDHGPTCDNLPGVREEVDGSAVTFEPSKIMYVPAKTRAVRSPDMGGFTAPQTAVIDQVIAEYLTLNAAQAEAKIKRERKGFMLWRMNETIPYASVFFAGRKLTASERAYALSL